MPRSPTEAAPNGDDAQPLDGVRVVNLSLNLPGPLVGARLADLGASVVKIEPPEGDPLRRGFPDWYTAMAGRQRVVRLDLRAPADRRALDDELAHAALLVAAMRPQTLAEHGLDWPTLTRRWPPLCFVGLVGYPPPTANRPGHDLTYQASAGLLDPPRMPRLLLADILGAEHAVSRALALLYAARRTGVGHQATVSLTEATAPLADILRYGATTGRGLLSGARPEYRLYETKTGWIALAALEPRFAAALASTLGLDRLTHDALTRVFLSKTADQWEQWAIEHDLPLAAVHPPPRRSTPRS